jgi:DNA invertase Pin-like site-specific DNA recombinase
MFQMLGVFAEFERGIIVERVKSGLSRARSQGKRLGRRRVGENVVECIREQWRPAREFSERRKPSASEPARCIR